MMFINAIKVLRQFTVEQSHIIEDDWVGLLSSFVKFGSLLIVLALYFTFQNVF